MFASPLSLLVLDVHLSMSGHVMDYLIVKLQSTTIPELYPAKLTSTFKSNTAPDAGLTNKICFMWLFLHYLLNFSASSKICKTFHLFVLSSCDMTAEFTRSTQL